MATRRIQTRRQQEASVNRQRSDPKAKAFRNLDHERFRRMVQLRSAVGQLLTETEDTTGAIAQAETAINAVDDFIKEIFREWESES